MKIDRSKFLGLCLSMMPFVAVACGGNGGDDPSSGGSDLSAPGGSRSPASASSASATAPAAAVVTVTSKPVKMDTDDCTADVQMPVVSVPSNKAAETAINATLAPLASPCDEGGEDISSSFEVTANGQGLLSIRVTGGVDFKGGNHPNGFVRTFNFDVQNGGKELQ